MRPHAAVAGLVAALSLPLAVAAPQGGGGQGNRGTTIQPGESCPPGMTEVRPRNCQAPTMPPPSILDYRPRNTLVAPAHLVPKAKFAAIDYHGHPFAQLNSAEGIEQLGAALDALNVRVIVA